MGVWLRCLAWIHGWRGSNFGVGRVSPYNFGLGKNSVVQMFVVGRVSDMTWVKKSINVLFLFIILKVLPICIYPFWLMHRSRKSPRFPESFFTDVFDKSGRSEISLFQIYLKGIIKLCGYLISWLEQNYILGVFNFAILVKKIQKSHWISNFLLLINVIVIKMSQKL